MSYRWRLSIKTFKQERIPVGCVPPTRPYMCFSSKPSDVSSRVGVGKGGTSSEQVLTGIHSWPRDVTGKGEGLGQGQVVPVQRGLLGLGRGQSLYGEVQDIMGNGHMGTPSPPPVNRQTRLKTLPCRTFICGR